jgi:hypothetical protein
MGVVRSIWLILPPLDSLFVSKVPPRSLMDHAAKASARSLRHGARAREQSPIASPRINSVGTIRSAWAISPQLDGLFASGVPPRSRMDHTAKASARSLGHGARARALTPISPPRISSIGAIRSTWAISPPLDGLFAARVPPRPRLGAERAPTLTTASPIHARIPALSWSMRPWESPRRRWFRAGNGFPGSHGPRAGWQTKVKTGLRRAKSASHATPWRGMPGAVDVRSLAP